MWDMTNLNNFFLPENLSFYYFVLGIKYLYFGYVE